MKLQKFEVIVEKAVDVLNARVNARIEEGWDVMFGSSRSNAELTKFSVWMALPVPPVPPRLFPPEPLH
jgi:hypothetical protein